MLILRLLYTYSMLNFGLLVEDFCQKIKNTSDNSIQNICKVSKTASVSKYQAKVILVSNSYMDVTLGWPTEKSQAVDQTNI